MDTITLSVNLYGSLSRLAGHRHVAQIQVELPKGATKADLITFLKIPAEERGYLFVNAVLFDVPGLTTPPGPSLQNGDHIGIFSVDRLWPYQYRDGIRMSPDLKEAMRVHGAMHHSYNTSAAEE